MTNWQQRAVNFAQKHNLLHDPGVHLIDLVSELGEVAKEQLLATQYGQHKPDFRADMAGELGDVLYSLCLLAEAAEVDLEVALTQTLVKYETRWSEKGHVGSSADG